MLEKKVKNHFDKVSEKYDSGDVIFPHLKKIVSDLLGQYNRCLDAGCGTGKTMQLLSSKCKNIVGVDFSKNMIKIARKRNPKAQFVLGDLQHLPFKDNSFDLVISTETIQYVSDKKGFLSECRRVLGRGHFFVTNPNTLWFPLRKLFALLFFEIPEGPSTHMTNWKFNKIIKESGFEIIEQRDSVALFGGLDFLNKLFSTRLLRPFSLKRTLLCQ